MQWLLDMAERMTGFQSAMHTSNTGPVIEPPTLETLYEMAKRIKKPPEPRTPSEQLGRALAEGVNIRGEHPLMPGKTLLVTPRGGGPSTLFATEEFLVDLRRIYRDPYSPSFSVPVTQF